MDGDMGRHYAKMFQSIIIGCFIGGGVIGAGIVGVVWLLTKLF